MIRFVLLAILLAAAVPATASSHKGHGSGGTVPAEILARPLPLRNGIGTISETMATRVPQAAAFYRQGIAYLHSFMWIEAARSFHMAIRLDPNAPLPWTGLARALLQVEDASGAREALARAQTLAAGAPPREKRLVAILAAQMAAQDAPADAGRWREYLVVVGEALAADPDDAELWVLRGQAEEGPGGIGMAGSASGIAFYEAALKRAPEHFGAHHYLVHAWEAVGRVDEALRHGEIYARLAPQVPHAHHMYAHNLRRAGRIEEATAQFEAAYRLEVSHYAREHIPREYDWHHPHNLSLLAMAYQYQGRMKDAERILAELWSLPPVTPFIEFNRKAWPEYLLVRGRTDEARAAAAELAAGPYPGARRGGHAMAGLALLMAGDDEEAGTELAAADAAGEGENPYVSLLEGVLLLRTEDDREAGEELLRTTMADIRAIPGPDAWMLALFRLELIASLAREAEAWDVAAEAADQMLEHDSAYAGSHYAKALVLERTGDSAGARREFAEAERLWRHADPDLQELRLMKERRA